MPKEVKQKEDILSLDLYSRAFEYSTKETAFVIYFDFLV